MTREEETELAWAMQTHQYALIQRNALKVRLCGEQNWRCCYCGCRLRYGKSAKGDDAPTFEHVVPKSKGGLDGEDNLVIACYLCNLARANIMMDDHIEVATFILVAEALS